MNVMMKLVLSGVFVAATLCAGCSGGGGGSGLPHVNTSAPSASAPSASAPSASAPSASAPSAGAPLVSTILASASFDEFVADTSDDSIVITESIIDINEDLSDAEEQGEGSETDGFLLLYTTLDDDEGIETYGSAAEAVPVPEPATIALLGIGLACLAGVRARSKWKKKEA